MNKHKNPLIREGIAVLYQDAENKGQWLLGAKGINQTDDNSVANTISQYYDKKYVGEKIFYKSFAIVMIIYYPTPNTHVIKAGFLKYFQIKIFLLQFGIYTMLIYR